MSTIGQTDIPSLISKLKQLFQEAENQAKSAEYEYGEGTIIPAINELRYAGSHMISFLDADNDPSRIEELDKAIRHCKRSIYDSVEARLMVLYSNFQKFSSTYKTINLIPYIPNYLAMLDVANEIREAVGSRKSDVSKDDHYKRLLKLHEDFQPFVAQLEKADIELRKDIARDLKSNQGLKIGIAVGVIGIAVALITWFFPRTPNPSDSYPITPVTTASAASLGDGSGSATTMSKEAHAHQVR